jgi:hypothetical protein
MLSLQHFTHDIKVQMKSTFHHKQKQVPTRKGASQTEVIPSTICDAGIDER